MSQHDPAFSGRCSCGRPCYGQSTCTTCDNADEVIEEEEKILCFVCEDEEVHKKGDYCPICKEEAEEAWIDAQIKEE